MAITTLMGKIALVAIAGGAVGSAIAFPVAKSLNSSPPKEFKLTGKEDYRKYCLFVTADDERQTIVLACPRDLDSNKTDIYLYKKQGEFFEEIESWNFQKTNTNRLTIKTIKDSKEETITLSQDKGFSQLNGQKFKDLCNIDWSDRNFESAKLISCNSWTTTLRSLAEEDPEGR